MTRLITSRYPNPSRSRRSWCAVSPRVWMLAAIAGLSGQLGIQADRRLGIDGSEHEKFNLSTIKSGWHLRLMPM